MHNFDHAVAPTIAVERLLDNSRYPVLIIGLLTFIPLLSLFVFTGVIYPQDVPIWGDDPLEVTGSSLMVSLLTAYLLMCFTASLRERRKTHALIGRLLDNPEIHQEFRQRGIRLWPLGIVFGIFNALFNLPTFFADYGFGDPVFTVGLVLTLGQGLMWLIIGQVIFFAVQESLVLHHLGKRVRLNLYNLEELNGFGKTALNSFLMVVGALALTTLQALDLEFRWINYRNGLIVGIPAVMILVPLPIWNLHRRIVRAKAELLAEINSRIEQTSTALEGEELDRMNSLLLRREQIQNLRNWPMSLSIATRFLVYAFIVPMAWAGAALVEILLDSLLPQ